MAKPRQLNIKNSADIIISEPFYGRYMKCRNIRSVDQHFQPLIRRFQPLMRISLLGLSTTTSSSSSSLNLLYLAVTEAFVCATVGRSVHRLWCCVETIHVLADQRGCAHLNITYHSDIYTIIMALLLSFSPAIFRPVIWGPNFPVSAISCHTATNDSLVQFTLLQLRHSIHCPDFPVECMDRHDTAIEGSVWIVPRSFTRSTEDGQCEWSDVERCWTLTQRDAEEHQLRPAESETAQSTRTNGWIDWKCTQSSSDVSPWPWP